jgi:hypothetical protein
MVYRFILFLIFSILAAPLEYHIKWAGPWSKGKAAFLDAVAQPLIYGLLFFYAVIIAIEALMHLAAYPQVAARPAVQTIKCVGYLLTILPFSLYVLRGIEEPLSDWWLTFQVGVAAASLILAVVIQLYTARAKGIKVVFSPTGSAGKAGPRTSSPSSRLMALLSSSDRLVAPAWEIPAAATAAIKGTRARL